MASFVALSCGWYLRSTEGILLQGDKVVTPTALMGHAYRCHGLILHDATKGLVGKTGVSDESVLLDLDEWLAPILVALSQRAGRHGSLWDFTLEQLRDKFSDAAAVVDPKLPSPHLYSLRHGGASDDWLSGRRTLMEIKIRGRWSCDGSLRRYSKATRLQREMSKLTNEIAQFGNNVERHFAALLVAGGNGGRLPFVIPARFLPALRQ